MIFLYNILFCAAGILGLPLILPAMLASPKLRATFPGRLGLNRPPGAAAALPAARGAGRRIWLHALSVGEVLSAVPLARELKNRMKNCDLCFSVSTATGLELAGRLLRDVADAVFFYPYDLIFSVRQAIRRIDPALVVIVETDIWPNFLHQLAARDVPVLLVNARLSARSFAGYRHFSFFFRQVLPGFARICTQSAADAERFRKLGFPPGRIAVTGNVKFDRMDRPLSQAEADSLRCRLKVPPGRKVLLAGSTHDGEEAVVSEAWMRLRREGLDTTLIVAPRDPRRAPALAQLCGDQETSVGRLSHLETHWEGPPPDIIIVDTIGELRKLYAVADAAFVGGSLVRGGGHNPLEAAAYSKPILFGPDMSDFAEISTLLVQAGGACRVRDGAELFVRLKPLLTGGPAADAMGAAANRVFNENKGAVARNLEVIMEVLRQRQGAIRSWVGSGDEQH